MRDRWTSPRGPAWICSALRSRPGRDLAAARAAPAPAGPPRPVDLLLDGLATSFTEGCAAGAPPVTRALVAFRSEDIASEDALRWLALASRIAGDGLWDHEAWE